MATSVENNSVYMKEPSNEVERLYRKFTYKCLQIIIQSRIESSTQQDKYDSYFSLSLPEDRELYDQIKASLQNVKSFPLKEQNVCVEIPLVTSDGDHMFLETWDLTFDPSSLDIAVNKPQHVYTKMGVTLKSLLCATRATPAYRLARNQGDKGGGYKINYRLYVGKPMTHNLGEGFKTYRAGALPSASGLLAINVAFRTRLLISPGSPIPQHNKGIDMRDNHFRQDSPLRGQTNHRRSRPQPCSPPHQSPDQMSESPYCFAVSPCNEREEDYLRVRLAQEAEAQWSSTHSSHSQDSDLDPLPEPVLGAFTDHPRLTSATQGSAAHPLDMYQGLLRRSHLAQEMTARLQQQKSMMGDNQTEEEKENILRVDSPRVIERMSSTLTNEELGDDFIMPPFATEDDPSDVNSFLGLMFQAPPNLESHREGGGSVDEYLDHVGKMVTRSEKDLEEMDEFCQSVIQSTSQEEGSSRETSPNS